MKKNIRERLRPEIGVRWEPESERPGFFFGSFSHGCIIVGCDKLVRHYTNEAVNTHGSFTDSDRKQLSGTLMAALIRLVTLRTQVDTRGHPVG